MRPIHEPARFTKLTSPTPFVECVPANSVAPAQFRHAPVPRVVISHHPNALFHPTGLRKWHRRVLPPMHVDLSTLLPVQFVGDLPRLYLRLAATPPHPDSFAALGIRPLPARGERWRKWLCLAPQDTNSYAIVLFGIMLQVSDPAHRPRRIASKRCAKLASGFGHISSSSIGGTAGSVGIVTITGSLANGSRPLVARTGSGGATAGTGSALATIGAGSALATARGARLTTRARAGAPAFSGPYQQRLPCAMRYCQWPARSDAGGRVVRHSANAGSTEHRTVHESTAANAPRGIQPSIPSRFACLWLNAFAPRRAHGGARPPSRDKEAGTGGTATSALRRTPSVWCEESADRRGSAGHRGL